VYALDVCTNRRESASRTISSRHWSLVSVGRNSFECCAHYWSAWSSMDGDKASGRHYGRPLPSFDDCPILTEQTAKLSSKWTNVNNGSAASKSVFLCRKRASAGHMSTQHASQRIRLRQRCYTDENVRKHVSSHGNVDTTGRLPNTIYTIYACLMLLSATTSRLTTALAN